MAPCHSRERGHPRPPAERGDHTGALVSLQTCPRLVLPPEALIASDGPDDRFRGLHLAQERNEGRV